MKKIFGLLSLFTVLLVVTYSCRPEAKKEVIVVPAAPVIIEKQPAQKTTTITLDKKGVKVVGKQVDVTIKKQ